MALDQRAFKTGSIDREFGAGINDNPFLLPENRYDWEEGWKAKDRAIYQGYEVEFKNRKRFKL